MDTKMNRSDLAYRRMAAEGGSGVNLLVALFDTLAGDLRRAAEAQRNRNIEQRCRETKHAFLVIGHLEEWVKSGPGGELAKQLVAFYSRLRCRLLEAQTQDSPELLERQMADVLTIREYWQGIELSSVSTACPTILPANPPGFGYSVMQTEQSHSSWSF